MTKFNGSNLANQDVEMRNSAEEVNELMEGKALSSLTAVDLLTDMYYTQNSLCPKNVSL